MQIPEIVNTIVDWVPTIDFDHALSPDDEISLFETTIRYVAGLLSGE
jgi:mannosyl-oligosaccharide alpha-1,2-mannosidase